MCQYVWCHNRVEIARRVTVLLSVKVVRRFARLMVVVYPLFDFNYIVWVSAAAKF